MIEIALANLQANHPVDTDRLVHAARTVLNGEGVARASLSLAVVDDATIHYLNRQYLQLDSATDVLSFLLEDGPDGLEGEVVVSADTAAAQSIAAGWSLADELLLYVIHGTLHLAGFNDHDSNGRLAMRTAERSYLERLGVCHLHGFASENGPPVVDLDGDA